MIPSLSVPSGGVTLHDGDLVLRPIAESDRAAIVASNDDPAIAQWAPTIGAIEAWLAKRLDWTTGDHLSWAIATADNPDELLGSLSMHSVSVTQLSAEIGYWLLPSARGRGLAARSVRLGSRFGFETVGLLRIALFHAVENVASCAVAESAGFQLEGLHRSSYRYGDGLWHDEHSHARLRTDVG